jgi:hypothetical protein
LKILTAVSAQQIARKYRKFKHKKGNYKLMIMRCGQLGGVSAAKMFRTVRRRMAELCRTFGLGEKRIRECLRQIEADLMKIPIQHLRKKKPTTRQLLMKKDVTT